LSQVTAKLLEFLGYRFENPGLLTEALTHRSASGRHNERLEFLGDGVLNMVIAADLFERYPRATEGELSRLRARLVKGETLADIGRQIQLGEFLQLGPGELKSGGFRRESILADALEAIIGSVYQDSGFAAAYALIERLYAPYLEALPDLSELKDPKTRLQEYLQARRLPLPAYQVTGVVGPPHAQEFHVSGSIPGYEFVLEGVGTSRRKAEQHVAERLLEALQERDVSGPNR